MECRRRGRPPGEGHHQLPGEGRALTDILESAGGAAAIAARAIALASIILVAGAIAFRHLVLGRLPVERRDSAVRLASLAATVGAWASTTIVLVAPLRLLFQAQTLLSPGDPLAPMAANVLGTTWGKGLALQAVSALIALAGFVIARRGRDWGWKLSLAAALALALSPALMGHAIAAESAVAGSVLFDWVHVLAAGGWTGTLCLIAAAGVSLRSATDGGETLAALITRFHRVALTCATALLASGVISLVYRVAHLRDLFSSAYGALFFLKLALVAVVAAFGRYHSRAGAERSRREGSGAVVRTLVSETAFAALTIAVTAVLVGSEPPGAA
ncbi:MAG: copper resistance D family protein [Gemmatimonadales bacterium]